MESNLETEVRRTGGSVLQSKPFRPPGGVLSEAIFAGHQLAYRRRGVLFGWYRTGREVPRKVRWATGINQSGETKSLVPCMTAIAIDWLKNGFRRSGVKRTPAKAGAE